MLKVRDLSIESRSSIICIDLSVHVATCSKRLVSNKVKLVSSLCEPNHCITIRRLFFVGI